MTPELTRIVDFRCEDSLRRALAASAHSATPVRTQPRRADAGCGAAARRVLVVAEVHDGRIGIATAKAVSCALRVGGELEVALCAAQPAPLAAVLARLDGVARVLPLAGAADPDPLAVGVAGLIHRRGSTHVFAPATEFGTALIVRLAHLFGATAVHDVMDVVAPDRFARRHGRAQIVTVAMNRWPVFATVRLGAFPSVNLPRHRPTRSKPS